MSHFFSKEKFSALSLQRRHKHAADLLRSLYEKWSVSQPPDPILYAHYTKLEDYLNLPAVSYTAEALSDRYHHHLLEAGLSLREHHLLPRLSLYDRPSDTPFLPIDIYLDHVRSAHNIGSIVRTTEALRLGMLYFPSTMGCFSSKKLQDTAMGTLDQVPYRALEHLNSLKRPRIALEICEDAISLYDYSFPKSFTLLLGNEEYGLSYAALHAADVILKIPLYGSKNSLNVACAFALVAGEIRRQLD